MSLDDKALATLVAKDEIRELALLYSRGVDRKDIELLRTLYTEDATDHHATSFSGGAADYIAFLDKALPHMRMSGHFICNHLVSVSGDTGEGEVYALCYHIIPDRNGGGYLEDFKAVRYIDRYRKEQGRWKFASRVVTYDYESSHAIATPQGAAPSPVSDPSYKALTSRLFARGPRP
jgi:ketosteroid isomerase-like protein